jgi:outer membrane protein insertion porin family/translocation and assembly module TamA
MRWAATVALVCAAAVPAAGGVRLDALDAGGRWQLRSLSFRGNSHLPARRLRAAILTETRPWYAPWRRFPPFDPVTFRTDLRRLRRLYERDGYYHARVTYDIEEPDGRLLDVVVSIDEGPPVRVERVDVLLEGGELPAAERDRLLAGLPLAAGDVFTQAAYEHAEDLLRPAYRNHGFARVAVTRSAEVDLARDLAAVRYRVESGPPSVFGETRISGAGRTGPAVVEREVAWTAGEPFDARLLERTRAQLAALRLFTTVRIVEAPGDGPAVDLEIQLEEGPPREVRLGIGWDTEEQIRGVASWRHYDFLGGARQLGVTAEVSTIGRAIASDFVQPHFPWRATRGLLLFSHDQDDEDPYTLFRTQAGPRLEWRATPRTTGFVFYRVAYDVYENVAAVVGRQIPGAADDGVVSGLGFGAAWQRTDDVLDPTRGVVTSATVEPVGGFLGGRYAFVRVVGEGRVFQPLVGRLVGTARLRLGAAQPTGGSDVVPLSERFYAGGVNSVRGYVRRHVGIDDGPVRRQTLIDDEPIGGQSLVEFSVELRHPITDTLGVAAFVDGGQVARRSFDFPFDDLRYGAGVGVRYRSPVGPLRLDLGVPNDPPAGDRHWQLHFSLGAAF